MASNVIHERIIKLSLDRKDVERGLSDVVNKLKGFDKSLNNIKSDSIDKVGNKAKILANSIGSMSKKIPIIGNVTDKISEIGRAAGNTIGKVVGLGNTRLSGIISDANNTSDSINDIGESAEHTSGKFDILKNAASVALGGALLGMAQKVTAEINKWTFAPIFQGFHEYERELESTRVLVTALGEERREEIDASMRELEAYAQTTKYSSQQMNSSLSQFVNQGIDLQTATTALKGWGNLAASAAASTQGFNSSLEFGIQQSLGMGYMDRMNWKSIENAKMGTIRFKQELIETAKAMGTLDEATIETYGGIQGMFLDGLSETHWLTNDVMMSVLEKYAVDEELVKQAASLYTFQEAMEATSEAASDAWSKMWVELIGKGEAAKEIWTPFGEGLAALVTAIPKTTTMIAAEFNRLEGRSAVLRVIGTLIGNIKRMWDGVTVAFKEVFGGSELFTKIAVKIIDFFNGLADGMQTTGAVTHAFYSIFKVLFSVLKAGMGILSGVTKVLSALIPDNLIQNGIILLGSFFDLIQIVGKIITEFFSFDAGNSELMKSFNDILTAVEDFWLAIDELIAGIGNLFTSWSRGAETNTKKVATSFNVLSPVTLILKLLAKSITLVTKGVTWLADKMNDFAKKPLMQKALEKLNDVLNKVRTTFNKVSKHFDGFTDKAKKVTDSVIGFIDKSLSNFNIFGQKVSAKDWGVEETANDVEKQTTKIANSYGKMQKSISDTYKDHKKENNSFVAGFLTVKDVVVDLTSKLIELGKTGFEKLREKINFSVPYEIFVSGIKIIGNTITLVKDKFVLFGQTIGEIFEPAIEAAKDAWEKFLGAINPDEMTLGDVAKAGLVSMWDFLKNIDYESIGENIGNIYTHFKKFFKLIKKPTIEVIEKLAGGLGLIGKSLSPDSIWDIAKLTLLYDVIQKLNGKDTILESISDKLSKLKDTVMFWKKDPGGIIENISGALKAFQKNIKANTILTFAMAFGVIAASMFLLARIPASKAKQAALLALEIAVIIAGVFTLIQFVSHKFGGGAKVSVGEAAKKANPYTFESLFASLGFPELKKLYNRIGIATVMLSLAGSLMMVVKSVKKLADMDWKKLRNGALAAGGLMLTIAGAVKLAGKGATLGDAGKILAIGYALDLITNVIKKITGDEYSDGVFQLGLQRLALIGTFLVAATGLLSGKVTIGGVSISTGNATMGTAASIWAITDSIIKLANQITYMNTFTDDEFNTANSRLANIANWLSDAVAVMSMKFEGNFGNGVGFGASFGPQNLSSSVGALAIAFGVWIVAHAISSLGEIDNGKIEAAGAIVDSIAIVLAAAVSIMSLDFSGFGKNIKTGNVTTKSIIAVVAIAFGIKLVADEVVKIGQMSIVDIIQGGAVVDMIGVVLAGATAFISKFGAGVNKMAILTMAVTIGGILLIGGMIQKLGEMPMDKLGLATGAVDAIALAIGGIMLATGKGNFNPAGIGALAVALIGLVAALYMFERLAQIPADQLMSALTAIGIFLGALVLTVGALALISAVPTLNALVPLLVALGFAALGIGAGIFLAAHGLTVFYELLKTIFTDIGTFIGGIIEWFTTGEGIIPETAGAIWDGIKVGWDTFWATAAKWGSDLVTSIGEGISGMGQWIGDKAKGLTDAIGKKWDEFKSGAKDVGDKIGTAFGKGMNATKEWLKEKADGLGDKVLKALDIGQKMWDSGKAIVEEFGKGISSAFEGVVTTVSGWLDNIKSYLPNSPAKKGPFSGMGWVKLGRSGKVIAEHFGNGLDAGLGAVVDTAGDKMGILYDHLQSAAEDTDNINLTPVYKLTVDDSQFDTTYIGRLMSQDKQILSFGYDQLNGAISQLMGQSQNIDRLVKELDGIKDRLDFMQNQNETQISEIKKGSYNPTYLDSTLVSRELAPSMSREQDIYKRNTDRRGGELPSLT